MANSSIMSNTKGRNHKSQSQAVAEIVSKHHYENMRPTKRRTNAVQS